MIPWEMCNSNLIIRTNGINATQYLPRRMTHTLLWDFDIPSDHLISARKPDLIVINKKLRTFKIVDFTVPADHRIKDR